MLDRLNQFLDLVIRTLGLITRWRVWLLLSGFFLLNWLLLFVHYRFSSPLFYGAVSAWVSLLGPEGLSLLGAGQVTAFYHYPGHVAVLGNFAGWAKLCLGLLLEGLVLGFATAGFAGSISRYKGHLFSGRPFWQRWSHLVLAWLVLNTLTLLAGILLPIVLAPVLMGSKRVLLFNLVMLPAIQTFLLALFFVAIPSVVIYGENVAQAVGRSLRLFWSRPLASIMLASMVLFLPILMRVASSDPGYLIANFRPEMVYWLLVAGLAVEIPANFLWMGSAVLFLADSPE